MVEIGLLGRPRAKARMWPPGVVEIQIPAPKVEVDPFQWTVFGLAGYVAARATSRAASYAMGDR